VRLRTPAYWLLPAALLAPSMVLTVARATEPSGGVWIRLVSFAPVALPLYALGSLLLLVRLAWPGDVARLRWSAGVLLVAVPLGLHVWWFSPQLTGPNPPPAESAQPLTVFTANLWLGSVDGLDLVAAAADVGADVLVLEEVTPATLARMEEGGVAEVWPYRVGGAAEGTAGTMVLSRFELGAPTRIPTRMDSWAVMLSGPDGPVRLLAVHPWPPTDPVAWEEDHAAVLSAAPGADLVVGDFNATPDHAPMRRLDAAGLHSVAERVNVGWQPTWPANAEFRLGGLVPLPPLVQIDHVLVGPRLAALSSRTVELPGTDHLAVVAEVAAQ
jgi:endonuclease/exonuclease/phosphatase family metal-dependent hydrolase